MTDLVAALGLVLAIEGLIFMGFPGAARRAAGQISATPDGALRKIGVVAAVIGVGVVWLVRG